MRAIAVVHGEDDETGSVGERLHATGVALEIARVEEDLGDPRRGDLIVVFGSSAAAYDDSLDFLADERAFLAEAVEAAVPIFGICFGAQLLCRVLGGQVEPAPEPEVGLLELDVLKPGPVEAGPWLEFHFDRFHLPERLVPLARTPRATQAFVDGPHLGVQFHPEITAAMFDRWSESFARDGELETLRAQGFDVEALAATLHQHDLELQAKGAALTDAFVARAIKERDHVGSR